MLRPQGPVRETLEIFIDESSQTKHRYLLIGGVVVPQRAGRTLEDRLFRARLPELPANELGWTKVSMAKLGAYQRFADVFFDNLEGVSPLELHLLVVDTHKQNHHLHNQGSREVGFNKEVFQLCDKFARLHPESLFHVYLDNRTTNSSTDDLRLILNRHRAKKNDPRDRPFRRVHFRHSHEWQCLQLVDLLIGATAYKINGHDAKPDASEAKRTLSDHILARAGVKDATHDTRISGKFTIWHRQLR
jgi:hypothetical protein